MMKILISGPVLSRSGYGEMARFAYTTLKSKPNLYDVYVAATNWGGTSNISLTEKISEDVIRDVKKTEEYVKNGNTFDLSLQITIPNEWKKIAPINIGYTAGIETNLISPSWLQPSQIMDKIIVISEHAKSGFKNTLFGNDKGEKFTVTTPVEVCHFPVRDLESAELDIDFKHDFNFLTVCQWSPRKNVQGTIMSFLEEFKYDEVGLVLKMNMVNDSLLDKERITESVKNLLSNHKDRKCSIYLIHGSMNDNELNSLYKHPKIKAIISTSHGEGFGFPLFEATYNELPVIATDWSGHLDFLSAPDEDGDPKKYFAKIDFELGPVQKEYVWPGVIEEGSSWAHVSKSSTRSRMREVYKNYPRFKSWAKRLSVYNKEVFKEDTVRERFSNLILNKE